MGELEVLGDEIEAGSGEFGLKLLGHEMVVAVGVEERGDIDTCGRLGREDLEVVEQVGVGGNVFRIVVVEVGDRNRTDRLGQRWWRPGRRVRRLQPNRESMTVSSPGAGVDVDRIDVGKREGDSGTGEGAVIGPNFGTVILTRRKADEIDGVVAAEAVEYNRIGAGYDFLDHSVEFDDPIRRGALPTSTWENVIPGRAVDRRSAHAGPRPRIARYSRPNRLPRQSRYRYWR